MLHRPILKILLLSCGTLLLMYPVRETTGGRTFPIVPKRHLTNVSVQQMPNGKRAYTIADLSYQKQSGRSINDLVLSFNRPHSQMVRDDTRHYRIHVADYSFRKGEGLGRGCAHFYGRNNRVEIETARDLWLGSCGDLGSFTVEFRMMPYSMREGGAIFSRVSYFSGEKRGLEMIIRNRRISARFYNMFVDPKGKRFDIQLNRGRILTENKWCHFSISYDRISGKLSRFCNGEEEETVYATESGDPYNGVYVPTFGSWNDEGVFKCLDSPSAVLGRDFNGLLDEFRITYLPFEELKKVSRVAYREHSPHGVDYRTPYNVEGVVTSPVYAFDGTGTKVTDFKWAEEIQKNSFIWMEFRIADQKFTQWDQAPRWYRITRNQHGIFQMKDDRGDYIRGRYYQWKAHLVASPLGKHAPLLYDLALDYQRDLPPAPPLFVEASATGDRTVVIRWKKSVEADILGYRIYYGTGPKRYDGIISHIKGERITNAMARDNYITAVITNELIDENQLGDQKRLLTYPRLENTVLYFFAVSAYDSYKPDTPFNHESELSAQVKARPYGGSEIR
ncbi:MAG: hypothetical protein JXA20_02920 [Spirochaetes bacterium]|nr:hypothetical protein [Spirochaetota bacterium]